METKLIQNPPNAAKLINSLRHLDYRNTRAISDIIDNSIDGKADYIWIDLMFKDGIIEKIVVSDNGIGMDRDVLDEALKLGSNTEKNQNYDLGCYGMGLITASISMGRRLNVITKSIEGPIFKSIQDIDEIIKENTFIKYLDEGKEEEKNLFSKYISERQKILDEKNKRKRNVQSSGTIVIIDKIDRPDYRQEKAFIDSLHKEVGQVYRKFLNSTIQIFIQNIEVVPTDPIYDYDPNILNEEEIKLENGSIILKITEIKDYGATVNREKRINIDNQGFYVLRNNREILSGTTLGIFTKHNDLNTLRIEFSYPGSLDSELALNFSKNRISLNQSISDKIEKACNPFIKQVRNRSQNRTSSDIKEDFSDVEKYITQKSHLLKRPQAQIEMRGPRTKSTQVKQLEAGAGSPRLDINKRKRVTLDNLKVKFDSKKLTERGPLYAAEMEKDCVIIYWNIEHPFYRIFIEKNLKNPDIVNPIYFLVYSLGNAELISACDSDSEEILTNIRFDVGRNLAVLLKD